jgi:hypothetical protein
MTFTKDEKAMLEFAMKYAGKWHTFAPDAKTLKAVYGLCRKISGFNADLKISMFRFSLPYAVRRINK